MKTTLLHRCLSTLIATAFFSLLFAGGPAEAALNIYAALQANGENITGETSVERIANVEVHQDHIEVTAFNHEAFVPGISSGQPTGRATFSPIQLVKKMDDASPLLQRAFALNEAVEGTFKFFRPNPETGETEHYYSIEITQARIVGIRTWQPNNLDPDGQRYPVMEEISIVYQTIVFRHETAARETSIRVDQP